MATKYLVDLNEAQSRAVTSDATGSLQILAPPGSGKTKTLTSRVAHLIHHDKIAPKDIIVITFANKAANEMKHRLSLLLGPKAVSELVIGTFHAACVRFLRRYGKRVSVNNNFVIADQADCLSVIKTCLKSNDTEFKASGCDAPKPGVAQDMISYAKAKGWTALQYRAISRSKNNDLAVALSYVYEDYQKQLAQNNALDFDDLLTKGLELVAEHSDIVRNVRHVLVDEFQDTNTTQYELVKQLGKFCKSVTVVGDPDQSIFGWRSAEVENIDLMLRDFKPCQQIFLEENYRSTGAVLAASLAVVEQDRKRVAKRMYTSQPTGCGVVLRQLQSAPLECAYIASEIKRLIAHSGGLLDYDDFAILLRYNSLSRLIESSFQVQGIPIRLVGGAKFFDRIEVKDVLAYLQLAENSNYSPALDRVINVPKRSIGAATIASLKATANERGSSVMDIIAASIKGSSIGGLTSAQKKNLKPFVKAVTEVRKLADQGTQVAELIEKVVELIDYDAYLEKYYAADKISRLENIEELKAFSVQVAKNAAGVPDDEELDPSFHQSSQTDTDAEDFELSKVEDPDATLSDGIDESLLRPMTVKLEPDAILTPLQTFLAAAMLSTDTERTDEEEQAKAKVTISTVHSAKGLEWPVVFLPAVEEGIFPFFKSTEEHQIDEERRLLYVGMTRAQIALYLTHASARMRGSNTEPAYMSKFLRPIAEPGRNIFTNTAQDLTQADRVHMSQFLRRPKVDEEFVARTIEAYNDLNPSRSVPFGQATSAPPFSRPNGNHASQASSSFGYRAYSSSQPLPRPQIASAKTNGFSTASAALAASQQPATNGFSSARNLFASPITPSLQKAADATRLSKSVNQPDAKGSKSSLESFQATANSGIASFRALLAGPERV